MSDLIPEGITRLLLVEGKEDQEFFIQLGTHLKIIDNWPLRIVQYGGASSLKERIRTLARPDTMEQIERIGIVRDADFNTNALRSVQDAIRHSNERNTLQLDIPQRVMEATEGSPSINVLTLPSAGREGMLEDLLMDVLSSDPVTACVDEYFDCLSRKGLDILQHKRSRARLRAFVTGKNASDGAEGDDSEKLYLSDVFRMSWWKDGFWDHTTFSEAIEFLTQLLPTSPQPP